MAIDRTKSTWYASMVETGTRPMMPSSVRTSTTCSDGFAGAVRIGSRSGFTPAPVLDPVQARDLHELRDALRPASLRQLQRDQPDVRNLHLHVSPKTFLAKTLTVPSSTRILRNPCRDVYCTNATLCPHVGNLPVHRCNHQT